MRKHVLQIMFLGTTSDAGKSIISAGFCRILKNMGYRVCPFKAQNMALNSFVTMEGDEMGRSQALQALACGIPPSADMNPILLKPSSDNKSQVILQGKVLDNFTAQKYYDNIQDLLPRVVESYNRIRDKYNAIILEGAGGAVELNLKNKDIVNLMMARIANAPVVLVADIERGGVFGSLYGTIKLLNRKERRYIIGTIINRFRGDKALFDEGIRIIERITRKKVFGVLPYSPDLYLPEEDSVALHARKRGMPKPDAEIHIGVVKLPYISNYTDFDPLELEEEVSLTYIEEPSELRGKDGIIIPGTKSTIMDLRWIRKRGFTTALINYVKSGGTLFGICGGYQMLGNLVKDPFNIESNAESERGLGLLPAVTTLEKIKKLENVRARIISDDFLRTFRKDVKTTREPIIDGYEIHMGKTEFSGDVSPLFQITESNGKPARRDDGCSVNFGEGKVLGTYIHGIFENDMFREAFLRLLGYRKPLSLSYRDALNKQLDHLASFISEHIDVRSIIKEAEKFCKKYNRRTN